MARQRKIGPEALGDGLPAPTIDVSVVYLTVELEKETAYEKICAKCKERSEGDMKGFLVDTGVSLVPSVAPGAFCSWSRSWWAACM